MTKLTPPNLANMPTEQGKSTNTSAQLPACSSPKEIVKELAILGLEMVSSGKMEPEQVTALQKVLAEDLKMYEIERVRHAITEHRKASPFWPSLSDLLKHIKPSKREEAAQMRAQRRQGAYFSNTLPKDETEEERESFLQQQERNKIENEGVSWP